MRVASFFLASIALHAAMLPFGNLRPQAVVQSYVPVTVLSDGDDSEVLPRSKASGSAIKVDRIAQKNPVVSSVAPEPAPSISSQQPTVSPPVLAADSGIALAAAESPKALFVREAGDTTSGEGELTNGTGEGIGGSANRGGGQSIGGSSSLPGHRAEVTTYVKAAYRTTTKPDYPERARREGKEGRVLLQVLVDEEGHSKKVEIDTSSGSDVLDQAARDAIKKWRFAPARQGDKAVESWVKIPIDFRLSDARN